MCIFNTILNLQMSDFEFGEDDFALTPHCSDDERNEEEDGGRPPNKRLKV